MKLIELLKTLLLSIIALLVAGAFAYMVANYLPMWSGIVGTTLVMLIVVCVGAMIMPN